MDMQTNGASPASGHIFDADTAQRLLHLAYDTHNAVASLKATVPLFPDMELADEGQVDALVAIEAFCGYVKDRANEMVGILDTDMGRVAGSAMAKCTLLELQDQERDLVRSFRLLDDHQKSVIYRFSMSEAGADEMSTLGDLEADKAEDELQEGA